MDKTHARDQGAAGARNKHACTHDAFVSNATHRCKVSNFHADSLSFILSLAGRPCKSSAADDVEVEVEDGLFEW